MGQNATEDRELKHHEGKGQQTIPQSALSKGGVSFSKTQSAKYGNSMKLMGS
jgi:hypothetical protein